MTISLLDFRSLKYTDYNGREFHRFPLSGRLSTPVTGVLVQIGLSVSPIGVKRTKHGVFSRFAVLRTDSVERLEGNSVGLVHNETERFSAEFPVYGAVFAHFLRFRRLSPTQHPGVAPGFRANPP